VNDVEMVVFEQQTLPPEAKPSSELISISYLAAPATGSHENCGS